MAVAAGLVAFLTAATVAAETKKKRPTVRAAAKVSPTASEVKALKSRQLLIERMKAAALEKFPAGLARRAGKTAS